MDPVSQGVVGAALAQSALPRRQMAIVALIGALAGMAADIDVLIQSPDDPLLFLEFHRQFTHSLVFIPVGALLVAGALRTLTRNRAAWQDVTWNHLYLAAFAGYASHGLLDSCTSYGTQLFWPFTDARVSWDIISIVDPLFTIPLLVGVIASARSSRVVYARGAALWALVYLGIGVIQHERAMSVASAVAVQRGHTAERLTVKPSFANLLVWKAIYLDDAEYYVDAVRVGPKPTWCFGQRIRQLDIQSDLPGLRKDSQQYLDLQRFLWFSDGYLAMDENSTRIIDMRYSYVPNEIDGMWGIDLDLNAQSQHVKWWSNRNISSSQQISFLALLIGSTCIEVQEPPA